MGSLDSVKDRRSLEQLFSDHGVVLAYLFGSEAEDRAGPLSDLDIAVLLDPEVRREKWSDVQLNLMNELMDLFDRNEVDLVVLNRATPVIAQQVAQHGQVLFEAHPGARVEFQVTALRRYVDTEPLRRIQDRSLYERVEEYRAVTERA